MVQKSCPKSNSITKLKVKDFRFFCNFFLKNWFFRLESWTLVETWKSPTFCWNNMWCLKVLVSAKEWEIHWSRKPDSNRRAELKRDRNQVYYCTNCFFAPPKKIGFSQKTWTLARTLAWCLDPSEYKRFLLALLCFHFGLHWLTIQNWEGQPMFPVWEWQGSEQWHC